MGWIKNVIGLAGNPAETVSAVANGLDGLFTSDDERLSHAEIMERIQQEPGKAQNAVNAIEAKHRSLFVAGWRPFVGWTCGLALAYQYLLNPLLKWGMVISAEAEEKLIYPPEVDLAIMIPILMGMLGLGALRTYEKKQGVTK